VVSLGIQLYISVTFQQSSASLSLRTLMLPNAPVNSDNEDSTPIHKAAIKVLKACAYRLLLQTPAFNMFMTDRLQQYIKG
jgi:hypothetical protein